MICFWCCPFQIHRFLDEHVIGQELAKKSLAVAAYNHYKRVRWCRATTQASQPKAKLGENLFAGKCYNTQAKTKLGENLFAGKCYNTQTKIKLGENLFAGKCYNTQTKAKPWENLFIGKCHKTQASQFEAKLGENLFAGEWSFTTGF